MYLNETGFVKNKPIPDANASDSSLELRIPVNPMMVAGTLYFSVVRIARVALNPSMTGIEISMNIRSCPYTVPSITFTTVLPLFTGFRKTRFCFVKLIMRLRLTVLSSTTKTRGFRCFSDEASSTL
jgi:hypothetical protein